MSESIAPASLVHRLLTALQVMAGLLLAMVTVAAAFIIMRLWVPQNVAGGPTSGGVFPVVGSAAAVSVGACCYVAILGFILLCQQLKQGRVFSEISCRWLARIVVSMRICAAVTLAGSLGLWAGLPGEGFPEHSPLYLAGLSFLILGVTLIARVLQLMCRRAMELQDENNLTI